MKRLCPIQKRLEFPTGKTSVAGTFRGKNSGQPLRKQGSFFMSIFIKMKGKAMLKVSNSFVKNGKSSKPSCLPFILPLM